ncbi:MAG: hypothetical protein R3Y63_13465 [Eubacteriales bacterium]
MGKRNDHGRARPTQKRDGFLKILPCFIGRNLLETHGGNHCDISQNQSKTHEKNKPLHHSRPRK